MLKKGAFDETLYCLVSSDSKPAISDFKTRIDQEPEFRAAFEQTRRTVVSLQGLGPKVASLKEATFTQQDIDKLTRDILRGYRLKFAEVLTELGIAYYLQSPQKGFADTPSGSTPSMEQNQGRLQKALSSYSSLTDLKKDSLTEELQAIQKDSEKNVPPIDQALSCLSLGQRLKPNDSSLAARQSLAWIRKEEAPNAERFAGRSLELARTREEKCLSVATNTIVFFWRKRLEDAQSLIETHLRTYPEDLHSNFNLATTKVGLRDTKGATDEFCRIFAAFSSEQLGLVSKIFRGNLIVVEKNNPQWTYFKKDKVNFQRFLKNIESYLGSELAAYTEGIV